MYIAERYVSAYIVECLTGIAGENQDRVYDFIEATEARMSHPLLSLVLDIARDNPDDQDIKDLVAATVMGYVLLENEGIADLMKRLHNPRIKIVETSAKTLITQKTSYR